MKTNKKRLLALFCAAIMLCPLLAACGGEGNESSSASLESEPEAEIKRLIVGDAEYELKSGINTDKAENGVYLFTGDYALATPKASDKDFCDITVLDGIVIEIGEKGRNSVIPEDGFVIRFRGVDASAVKLGEKAELADKKTVALPESYVRFGDVFVEVGYKNTVRTAEDTGWLYDENWYTGNTESNIYCTEIAICDGKIVEINRSRDEAAGIAIPKGGYVLTVGENSANERKVQRLKVGDEAVLVEGEKLYTSKRLTVDGSNTERSEDGITLYTSDKYTTTPVGLHITEVLVNKNGSITEIFADCSGMKKVPKGGFVISASGISAEMLKRMAEPNALVIKNGPRNIRILTTPKTELERLKAELDVIKSDFDSALERLDRIDFEGADKALQSADAEVEAANKAIADGDAQLLAESVIRLYASVKEAKNELVPYITVQDRMAWVTIGEYDYSKNVVLHYTNQNDVDHTVAYAKHCGLNTLIIDNHVAGFAVYNSEVEGFVAYRDYKDFDIIAAFKKACDAEGLRLVVMVNAFSSGLEDVAYPENHYMSIYKDKYLLTNRGRVAGPDGVITLDPADDEIQRFNLAIVKEIAEKYDVDGIQADYMRYPLPYYYQEHNYEDFGYNESSKSGFIKKYGKDPAKLKISDPLWEKWCAWRRDIISDYQKRFYETVKAVNPELHVSFTCFADYRDRQIYTYQDVEKWAENGYADAIFPMIYGDTTEYQQKYAEEILPVTEHTQVVLGVGTYVRATHKSIEEQFIMPYELYCEGVSVFTLRYICTCGYDKTVSNAFRAEATPTAAPDSELIKASAEMMTDRIKAVRFALGYAGKLSDAESGALDALAARIEGLGKSGDFIAFSAELGTVCTDIESDTALTAAVKEALLKELNYIIGLK